MTGIVIRGREAEGWDDNSEVALLQAVLNFRSPHRGSLKSAAVDPGRPVPRGR